MKHTISILILFTLTINAQVSKGIIGADGSIITSEVSGSSVSYATPEQYGAIGDGITDDSDAFEDAINNNETIVLDGSSTYLIATPKVFTRTGKLFIKGNNAVLKSGSTSQTGLFEFSEDVDLVNITDLEIDGNFNLRVGLYIKTNFNLNNVYIHDLYDDVTTVVALRIDVNKQLTKSIANNVIIDDIDADQDSVIGNSAGASRAVIIDWNYTSENTYIEFTNSKFSNVYGDDGDIIQIAQKDNIYDHGSTTIFKNCEFSYASRRICKGTASGIKFYDCLFKSTTSSNARVIGVTPAGMLTFSIYDDTETPDARNLNCVVSNCEFDNTLDYDGRVISTKNNGLTVSESTFINSNFVFNVTTGNISIINNNFINESYIYNDGDCLFEGTSSITGNTYTRPETGDGRGLFDFATQTNPIENLVINNNTIVIHSDATELAFGLGYIATGVDVKNLLISNNTITRDSDVSQRSELIRIDGNIISGVSIINNFMQSTTYSTGVGIDINGTGTLFIKNNYHSSGQLYPEN